MTLSLLIDEEDGVVADCKFEVFGSPAFQDAVEAAATLLLRKNYMQAKRLSADLIETKMTFKASDEEINLVLEAIDIATADCLDILIEDFLCVS